MKKQIDIKYFLNFCLSTYVYINTYLLFFNRWLFYFKKCCSTYEPSIIDEKLLKERILMY